MWSWPFTLTFCLYIGIIIISRLGSMLTLVASCNLCPWTWTWISQPFINETPAGNILISAATLFSGSIAAKTFKFLQHLKVCNISIRTFFRHQKEYLFPTITKLWHQKQRTEFEKLQEQPPITVGGDGRADSPGHCAKYGTYTLIDLDHVVILELQTVQVCSLKHHNLPKFYSERPQGAGFRSVNPAERWRENPVRALARAGFSQHLECGIHQSESSPEGSFALIPRPVARRANTAP